MTKKVATKVTVVAFCESRASITAPGVFGVSWFLGKDLDVTNDFGNPTGRFVIGNVALLLLVAQGHQAMVNMQKINQTPGYASNIGFVRSQPLSAGN